MLKRILTGVILAGLVVGMFFLRTVDPVYFDAFIMIIMLLAVYEMCNAFNENLDIVSKIFALLTVGLIYPAFTFLNGLVGVFAVLLLMFVVNCCYVMFNSKLSSNTIKDFALILIYPISILSTILVVNNSEFSLCGLLLIFAIAPMTDTMAYFTGRLIGGKKLCPNISPNKTIAGAIGGLVGGIVASIVVFYVVKPLGGLNPFNSIVWIILVGLLGAVISQLGDLTASKIKRDTGIKDYGNIFLGHGGIMDRMDSIIFVAVLVFVVFLLGGFI